MIGNACSTGASSPGAWPSVRLIIAISQYTARDIEKFFGLPGERIAVIHNGLDHERFHPGSREQAIIYAANRFGLDRPFFLYVSRLEHPGKNHVRLISAFEDFKTTFQCNWQLALAGGDWHGAQIIHEAIRNSKFANDIRCLGFVPDGQLPELYRAADVFVYPSLHEGFGLPPIEAMACGCPVIASTRGALAEVIGLAHQFHRSLQSQSRRIHNFDPQPARVTLPEQLHRKQAKNQVLLHEFPP